MELQLRSRVVLDRIDLLKLVQDIPINSSKAEIDIVRTSTTMAFCLSNRLLKKVNLI